MAVKHHWTSIQNPANPQHEKLKKNTKHKSRRQRKLPPAASHLQPLIDPRLGPAASKKRNKSFPQETHLATQSPEQGRLVPDSCGACVAAVAAAVAAAAAAASCVSRSSSGGGDHTGG